jgi:membrane protein DedA with SNARE-associated domain
MDKIINFLIEQIRLHGVLAVFFGSFVEEAIAPIPSPAVMMGSGFILLEKYQGVSTLFIVDLLKIALIGGLGALLGSYIIYALGYFGGKPVIEKTKRFTGLKWSHIEKFQAKLESGKRDEVTIAMLRAIPVMPAVVISGSCGLLRVNILSYSISFYIGGVVRNIIFLIIGWKIGNAYQNLAHTFDSLQNVITILIAVLLVGGLGYLYWRREKEEKVEEPQA